MTGKKVLAGICILVLVVSCAAGCGKDFGSQEGSSRIVRVTNVDGQTITGQPGTLKEPKGKGPEGEKPEGTPPARPGEEGDESNVPTGSDLPPQGAPGGPGGSFFEAEDGTITFGIDESTKIVLEQLQGETDGNAEDIVEGAVLEITLEGGDHASKVIVKNLQAAGGFGGSETVSNGTAALTIDKDTEESEKAYESDGDDENALRIDGVCAILKDVTVGKMGGQSSNTENGDFYGANAGLLALNGAVVSISGAEVTTDAVNGNGIFSYGKDTIINVSDSRIRTAQHNSGGIQTTGGGTMNASGLDVETKGNSAAAIRSDRGGGTVTVDGGKFVTKGTGSPAVYSTADITVKNAVLQADASEGIVVEGKNFVTLEECSVTSAMEHTDQGDPSENIHGIMIYQSMSGDADVGEATFSARSGSITVKSGDMFYVTNTDCEIYLEDVDLKAASDSDTLLRVEGNHSSRGWGKEGANGGDVVLTAKDQKLSGNIIVDKISSLDMTLSAGSVFEGTVNPDGEAGQVKVVLNDKTVWKLTGDSYISDLQGDTARIEANGHHLYVDGKKIL